MDRGVNYDIVIIGGGPAGMSAALWGSDLGMRSILIESSDALGGQLKSIFNPIENYLGLRAPDGATISKYFLRSLEKAKFELRLAKKVVEANLAAKTFELDDGARVSGDAVIIATGVRRRKLHVPGEEEFAGKGILTSGSKEARMARGKNVVIVGGGDAAMENALILSEHARSVTLVHRRNEFKARGSFVEDARGRSNITFLTDSTVKRFIGSSSLEAVELFDLTHGDSKIVAGDLALIRIGVQPNSELFCPQLDTDDSGYILVSSKFETSARNVYAIGDVANPHSLTIATSAGNAAAAVGHVFHTSQMRKSNPKN